MDRTIFHPLGSGQLSDKGYIKASSVIIEVRKALDVNGVIAPYGVLIKRNPENLKDEASLSIDREHRYFIMRLRIAGHILDYAVKRALGKVAKPLRYSMDLLIHTWSTPQRSLEELRKLRK